MSDPSTSDMTEQNRRAWNEIAGVRHTIFPPAAFFSGGGSTLDPRAEAAARQIFPDFHGLRVIHLQCATGEDTLSWSVLGAAAYGVDISDEQIRIAQQKAADAQLSTRFHASDLYALPASLPPDWLEGGFDLVFTGGGAIVWLPNLDRWASVVASLLRPAGRLVLVDEHPLSSCIEAARLEDGAQQLNVVDDYFRRAKPWEGPGWSHFRGGEFARENKYEFNWPLGDVVTALAGTGLVIEKLVEFPGGPEWRFGPGDQGQMGRMPGQYLLVARKENAS